MEEFREDLRKCFDEMNDFENQSFETLCTQYHTQSQAVVEEHSPIIEKVCRASQPKWIKSLSNVEQLEGSMRESGKRIGQKKTNINTLSRRKCVVN